MKSILMKLGKLDNGPTRCNLALSSNTADLNFCLVEMVLMGDKMAWGNSFNDWPKERNNNVPTHDPYANPNAMIYYECDCGAILDPGIKSFAALNGVASKEGWKIRFGQAGYTPYCVKCGEGIE